MPRRGVEFLIGEFYHLYDRGVDRGPIFHGPENYRYFLGLLHNKARRHEIELAVYCLMPNHFHLLVRPGREDSVSPFLAGVCGSYAQALNARRERVGALFQGRYRAEHVDRDAYLMHLARYIHINPVAAGLVVRPQDWPYSNYRDTIAGRQAFAADGPLFGGLFPTGRAYRDFVERPQTVELPGSFKLPGS